MFVEELPTLTIEEFVEDEIYKHKRSRARGVAKALDTSLARYGYTTIVLLPTEYRGVPNDEVPWSDFVTQHVDQPYYVNGGAYHPHELLPDAFPFLWEITHILDDLTDMENTSLCGFNLSKERLLPPNFAGFEVPENSRGPRRQVVQVDGIYKPLCHTCLWRAPKREESKYIAD